LSGVISAKKADKGIRLDFPRNDPAEVETPREIMKALGLSSWREVIYSKDTGNLLVILEDYAEVQAVAPDFIRLSSAENELGVKGIIVTAESSRKYDFVSRYFAPWVDINKDPVTGSAHTVLTPYWADKLRKSNLLAYQASERGGDLSVELKENRLYVSGSAVTVIEGHLNLPA